jgi:hypothetical protein
MLPPTGRPVKEVNENVTTEVVVFIMNRSLASIDILTNWIIGAISSEVENRLEKSTLVAMDNPETLDNRCNPRMNSPAANVRLYDPAARVAPEVVQTTRSTAADITHDTVGILPDPFSCPAGCSLPEKKFAGRTMEIVPDGGRSICETNKNTVAEDVGFRATASKSDMDILTP